MLAIAAAVIGGTSLFGGRGNVWSALLGMLVALGKVPHGFTGIWQAAPALVQPLQVSV